MKRMKQLSSICLVAAMACVLAGESSQAIERRIQPIGTVGNSLPATEVGISGNASKQKALDSSVLISRSLESLKQPTSEDGVFSPNAFKLPYLGLDGTFTIDPTEISATDPRNPKRVVFNKMEFFSFYNDTEGNTPIAQNCRYVYKGAVGDPFYYPKQSKTSIWDLFELVSGDNACNQFYYVILRSPHGDPGKIHMHMRYGDANSSFLNLLNLSNVGPEDKTKINPWWSVYCTEGVSGCDQ